MSAPASCDIERLAEALARLLEAYWRRCISSDDPHPAQADETLSTVARRLGEDRR